MVGPDLDAIAAAALMLDDVILKTPVLSLTSARWGGVLPDCASVTLKLELVIQKLVPHFKSGKYLTPLFNEYLVLL